MANRNDQARRRELHEWVLADLAQSSMTGPPGGVLQALLDSTEMDNVWEQLRNAPQEFRDQGSAVALLITVQGALRGPHRVDCLSKKERQQKMSRIDTLCAELAREITDLRDVDFDLPLPLDSALEDAVGAAFHSWENRVFEYAWTDAVLVMTDCLERRAGTRGNWSELVDPDSDGVRRIGRKRVRESLRSSESIASEAALGPVMEHLKEGTEAWLQRTIKDVLEPILWGIQDGVRALESEPPVFHKPRDTEERWAFVVRCVHRFLEHTLGQAAVEPTAIVIRALQNATPDPVNAQEMTASKVSEIVARRRRHKSQRR